MGNEIAKQLWIFPVFLLLAGSAFTQQTDVIELKNGSTDSGSVQGFTVTHYVFKTNQGNNEIPRERVKNVRYWDVTKPLGRLEQAFQNRRYERVVQFGEQVRAQIENGDLRELHLPRVLYFLATAHFRQGNLGQAVKLAKSGLSKPGHIWFDRLVRIRLLGETFQVYNPEEDASDDTFEEIRTLGKELVALTDKVEAPDEIKEYIKLLRFQALEELGEGQLHRTTVLYKNMDDLSDPVLQQRKVLGHHRSLVRRREDLQSVVDAIQEKLQQNKGSVVLKSGKAFAEGVEKFQEWKEQKKDSGLVHGAISSFTRAQVVFDPSSELYTIQHRQTLLHSMELFQDIATSASDDARKTFFSRQAQEAHDELVSRYPGSPEAQKAGVLIQN